MFKEDLKIEVQLKIENYKFVFLAYYRHKKSRKMNSDKTSNIQFEM